MESEQQDASFFIATRNDDRTGAGSQAGLLARSFVHIPDAFFFSCVAI
jgi:hypothetical protein